MMRSRLRSLTCQSTRIANTTHTSILKSPSYCHRWFSTTPSLSACIVGSGPSGFYTAKYLLKKLPNIRISIVDELPTPFGLVRYGVAPDHSDTKNVINDFTDNVLSDDRVSFFGNVKLTRDVSLSDLQRIYDAVILSYGASNDRKLDIAGEDSLQGIYSSRQFVNWYNGHPRFVDTITDSDFVQNKSGNVVVIGQGNVAIDCARILASNLTKLASTDITAHALDKLSRFEDQIKQIYVVGRRGAVQASFTNKELREIISDMSDDCLATVNRDEMSVSLASAASQREIEEGRAVKRKISIFERAFFDDSVLSLSAKEEKKAVNFRFLLSPYKFVGDGDGRVQSVVFERNTLSGESGEQRAVGSGEFVEIEAGLVLTSIGYKAESIADIDSHWNMYTSTVKHKNGRINDKGLYCAGWLKRGSSGIIGTNIPDAQTTASSIIGDVKSGQVPGGRVGSGDLVEMLRVKKVGYVSKEGWFKIDAYERKVGEEKGKPREKLTEIARMVEVANIGMKDVE